MAFYTNTNGSQTNLIDEEKKRKRTSLRSVPSQQPRGRYTISNSSWTPEQQKAFMEKPTAPAPMQRIPTGMPARGTFGASPVVDNKPLNNHDAWLQAKAINDRRQDIERKQDKAFEIEKTGIANQNLVDLEALKNQNKLAQEEAKDKLATQRLALVDQYAKGKDIRGLGIDAVKSGMIGPEVNNLLNYEGKYVIPSLKNIQFPQKLAPSKGYSAHQIAKDKTGREKSLIILNKDTGENFPASLSAVDTVQSQQQDIAASRPGKFSQTDVNFAINALGKIDPQNITPEQERLLLQYKEINRPLFDYLVTARPWE